MFVLSYISGTFTAENYIHSITFKLKFSKWKIGKQDSAWVETCNLPFKYNKGLENSLASKRCAVKRAPYQLCGCFTRRHLNMARPLTIYFTIYGYTELLLNKGLWLITVENYPKTFCISTCFFQTVFETGSRSSSNCSTPSAYLLIVPLSSV